MLRVCRKTRGGGGVTAKLLSYWTSTDCNTTWGAWNLMSSILIVGTLISEVNKLQPHRCNIAVVLRLNKVLKSVEPFSLYLGEVWGKGQHSGAL